MVWISTISWFESRLFLYPCYYCSSKWMNLEIILNSDRMFKDPHQVSNINHTNTILCHSFPSLLKTTSNVLYTFFSKKLLFLETWLNFLSYWTAFQVFYKSWTAMHQTSYFIQRYQVDWQCFFFTPYLSLLSWHSYFPLLSLISIAV